MGCERQMEQAGCPTGRRGRGNGAHAPYRGRAVDRGVHTGEGFGGKPVAGVKGHVQGGPEEQDGQDGCP